MKISSSFKAELKKQLRYAIGAAIGFMIIYVWREAIVNLTKEWVQTITNTTSTFNLEISSALAVTVIGVLLLFLSSKLLKD